jgi:hypothetical protein
MEIGAEAGAIERLMAYRRSGTKKGPGLLARLIDLVMWKNWLVIQKFLNELYDTLIL